MQGEWPAVQRALTSLTHEQEVCSTSQGAEHANKSGHTNTRETAQQEETFFSRQALQMYVAATGCVRSSLRSR